MAMLVRRREPADEAHVDRVLAATADRVAALDSRVRLPRRLAELPPGQAGQGGPEAALVAVDDAGRVRGHVQPRTTGCRPGGTRT